METIGISDQEFAQFQRFIHDVAGIALSPTKKTLVCGRLAKRLAECQVSSYGEYFRYLNSAEGGAETQRAIDLLTTNETYFFREPKHFEQLRRHAKACSRPSRPYRVWSAACSSGEEPYSIAMVLADCLGDVPWEVVGSDICTRMLQRARQGHYSTERTEHIPPDFLRRFCLRGIGSQQGTLLIQRALRARVSFQEVNLNRALPSMGAFDVIFLRNVMIYFNADTKREVVARLLPQLRPDGHFYVGHSETLHGVSDQVVPLAPAIYQRRGSDGERVTTKARA